MSEVVKAKLFTHGGSQAVRLPKAFRFQGTEVRARKEGERVILEPIATDCAALWAAIDANKTGRPEDDWRETADLSTSSDEKAADVTW